MHISDDFYAICCVQGRGLSWHLWWRMLQTSRVAWMEGKQWEIPFLFCQNTYQSFGQKNLSSFVDVRIDINHAHQPFFRARAATVLSIATLPPNFCGQLDRVLTRLIDSDKIVLNSNSRLWIWSCWLIISKRKASLVPWLDDVHLQLWLWIDKYRMDIPRTGKKSGTCILPVVTSFQYPSLWLQQPSCMDVLEPLLSFRTTD